MASIELKSSSAVCRRCGIAYGQVKGFFPVSYSYLYKGSGYLPYCKKCVEDMYLEYLAVCKEPADAVRQMCRKLDLYWNQKIFDTAMKQNTSRSIMTSYFSKINSLNNAGKCYDDTLKEEGSLWDWGGSAGSAVSDSRVAGSSSASGSSGGADADRSGDPPASPDIVAFWGPGYTSEMYAELEQRLQYYRSKMPEITDVSDMDMNTEMLLRQIAMMEIDINRARADGRPVDKMTSSLSSLLKELQKPKKDDVDSAAANTPFGVWIKRWEDQRPIPEPDEDLKDVDGIKKYILTWFYGHLARMLGIKNRYSKMYDDEIARYRVERPEYDNEDDETIMDSIFGGNTDGNNEE